MNIVLLTGLYPLPVLRKWEKQNTKADHYYALEWKKAGHKVIVLHAEAEHILRNGPLFTRSERYKFEGIPVCRIRYPRLIPHSQKVLRSTAKHAERIAKRYIAESGMDHVDLFYCDFATSNMEIIFLLKSEKQFQNSRFVPIFNNCDFIDLKRAKAIAEDAPVIGARAESQKKRIRAIVPSANVVITLSGAPEISDERVGQKVSIGARPKKFLFAAELIPLKNADILIQSFAKVCQIYRDTELTIVGDGPERARLTALADSLELRDCVRFTGAVSRQRVLELMVESDIFVMVSSPETFGIVYVEALSAGCCVIAALGEGIDGVITDGVNGALVEPRNVDALTNKMRWYLELSDEERQRLLSNAYQTAQMYTEEKVAEKALRDIDIAFRGIG